MPRWKRFTPALKPNRSSPVPTGSKTSGPIQADHDRVQQVVWNLVTNAVKFTPKGGEIRVKLNRESSFVLLSVSDNGQGVTKEFLPYIFERFRQEDATTRRNPGGWGWDWRSPSIWSKCTAARSRCSATVKGLEPHSP